MGRIPVLDGWRAVAISLVLWHHAAMAFYPTEAQWENSLSRFGAFGVDIFFALSGLLITRLLLLEHAKYNSLHLAGFYVRRAFRILPAFGLFLVGLTAIGAWISRAEILSSLLFFRNYLPIDLGTPESMHLWSLAVEEHFYILWPGLLYLLLRHSRQLAANAAVMLAIGIGLWRMLEPSLDPPLFPLVPEHFRTDLRLDALLWGSIVAFSLDGASIEEKLRSQLKLPAWIAITALAVAGIYYYSLLTGMFVAVLIPFVLAGTYLHPDWLISRALSWGPVLWVGRISYSLYLWQQLLLLQPFGHSQESLLHSWPWNLVATFAIAACSYHFIEVPMIGMGRGLSKQLRTRWLASGAAAAPEPTETAAV